MGLMAANFSKSDLLLGLDAFGGDKRPDFFGNYLPKKKKKTFHSPAFLTPPFSLLPFHFSSLPPLIVQPVLCGVHLFLANNKKSNIIFLDEKKTTQIRKHHTLELMNSSITTSPVLFSSSVGPSDPTLEPTATGLALATLSLTLELLLLSFVDEPASEKSGPYLRRRMSSLTKRCTGNISVLMPLEKIKPTMKVSDHPSLVQM